MSNPPFSATIAEVFQVTGRGCAIVLEDSFQGTVATGQVLKIAGDFVKVIAVEMLDQVSEGKAWVTILIDDRYTELAKSQLGHQIYGHAP